MPRTEAILHPVAISQVMINFAANQGVDVDTCLLGTGISEQNLQDGNALIERTQEMRLIENLILALPNVPALGFKLGLQYNMATFGIWGFAIRTSRTLRDATTMALRYLPLSTAYCHIHSFEKGDNFGISFDPEPIPSHLRQFLLERDAATSIILMKELSLAGVTIVALEFQGEAPAYSDYIAEIGGIKPTYNSSHNGILVRKEDADRPLPTYDAHLVRVLDNQCQRQLQARQIQGLAGQVRQQLLGPLGLVATLEEVADALTMSARTLRRKLDQEGISFRAVVDEERRQIALQLLDGSDMKLDELAIHLGYTDTASFTRAFRRWMECSPGEYRKSQTGKLKKANQP